MSFKTPARVWEVVDNLIQADLTRASNRARINSLFNGDQPFTEAEMRENSISTNVNRLDGPRIIAQARSQLSSAHMKSANYFSVNLDYGNPVKKQEWANIITRCMNRKMKRCRPYADVLESQFASTILHGIGPVTWLRDKNWKPIARGIEDVFVPTGTYLTLENLTHFAIYVTFTAAELSAMKDQKGWNNGLIDRLIEKLSRGIGNQSNIDDWRKPEKIVEDIKMNSIYWQSDRVPVCRCYDFYFLDTEKNEWRRRIIVDQQSEVQSAMLSAKEFLFDPGNRSYGEDISQIMHIQTADGCVVPPFRWHSVRSLGYLLYAVCHLQNRIGSKLFDSAFESMKWYFRGSATGDQERIERVDLHHLGIIPDGLSWVLPQERHQVDFGLISGAMQMNRQTMADNSASFTTDLDTSKSEKEMTATEIMARVNNANALLGSMLTRSYEQQVSQYREIARRFITLKSDKDCLKFREMVLAEGVPQELLTEEAFEYWEIQPERTIGNGNKLLQMAESEKLMAVRPLMSPQAQRVILHQYVEANSDDPHLADVVAPLEEEQSPTPTIQLATLAWGTLIDGKPVIPPENINVIEYVETLLSMLSTEQPPFTPERARGILNIVNHLKVFVQMIAQDDAQVQRAKGYAKALETIEKVVSQTVEEQEDMTPQMVEAQTKADLTRMQGAVKADVTAQNAQQKRMQREIAFTADQKRKDLAAVTEAQRKLAMANVDSIVNENADTQRPRS